MRTNCSSFPTPPAQTSGMPRGASSSNSASGVAVPAWPPARALTQMKPSTPASRAFSAQRRAVTS